MSNNTVVYECDDCGMHLFADEKIYQQVGQATTANCTACKTDKTFIATDIKSSPATSTATEYRSEEHIVINYRGHSVEYDSGDIWCRGCDTIVFSSVPNEAIPGGLLYACGALRGVGCDAKTL